MEDQSGAGLIGALSAIGSGIWWVIQNIAMSFYNLGYAVIHPQLWLDWSNKEAILNFVYYGGSIEFFFVAFTLFLTIFAIGLFYNGFLWRIVQGLEGLGNGLGRLFAWAGLLMVLQQVVIVFMQRIFAWNSISIGVGIPLEYNLLWYAESLKFYNALIVCLCLTYTFVQGGHVRVDLIYAPLSYRARKVVDMVGSMIFMIPVATVIWMYSWFFMWRHLIVPKPAATDQYERLIRKARALRWNVETEGVSGDGFNAYFLFKILIVIMVGLIFIQAWAFFYRSFLEWKEGQESEGKFLDHDTPTGEEKALEAAGH